MRTEYIYVLTGDSGIPFYCGHSVDPTRRLQQHIDEAMSGSKTFKCGHIQALISKGQTIRIKVVDQCPADELDDLEAYWIDQLEWKYFLYNSNKGRRGPKQDEVQERKNSQSIRRSLKSQKRIAAMEKRMAGWKPSEPDLTPAQVEARAIEIRAEMVAAGKLKPEKSTVF